jgi:hypothetical protein
LQEGWEGRRESSEETELFYELQGDEESER